MKKGVTLIELMVVVAVMSIITAAALVVFKTTATNEVRQQANVEQMQNLRAAFYTVARDVRMAGNGLSLLGAGSVNVFVDPSLHNADIARGPGWFQYADFNTHGVVPIFGTDSGTDPDKADTLTIFRSDVEAINDIGTLSVTFTPGSSGSITLNRSITEGVEISDGDILGITNGVTAIIVQASLPSSGATASTINLGARFRPAAPLPNGEVFGAGSIVYNLKNVTFVTYYLDMENARLMANYHDGTVNDNDSDVSNPHLVVVANNIEDFQVNYFLFPSPIAGGDPPADAFITENNLTTSWVGAVKIGMVSRSASPLMDVNQKVFDNPISDSDKEFKKKLDSIDLMGHKVASKPGYTRRTIIEIVQLRNS